MKSINLKSSAPPLMGSEKYFKLLEKHLTPSSLAKVRAAYQFAKYGHASQLRDDGITRYFDHVKAVSLIVMIELKYFDWRLLVLCLLHDIKEDTWLLTWYIIKRLFGEKVKNGIVLLTKEQLRTYVPNLIKHGDVLAIMAKVIDRVHNMRTLTSCSEDKQIRKTKETRKLYIPLAKILITRLSKNNKHMGEYLLSELNQLCEYYEKKLNI